MTTSERNELINAAIANMDNLTELFGNSAIASRNNSNESLIVAIWHEGSSTNGEADEYVEII